MATKTKREPDLTEFYKLAAPKKKLCQIGYVLKQLEAAEVEQLQAACDQDPGIINTGAIQKWLAQRGHKVSVPAITGHRRETCTCNTEE